ncbi:hypothetical protein BJ166DRAFT_595768 [Pestalotiopsis sp. NC0098]|nr:hypothetical protein BJ166DRAFT_595768 [Pestalotiopsis sp. NC0098]
MSKPTTWASIARTSHTDSSHSTTAAPGHRANTHQNISVAAPRSNGHRHGQSPPPSAALNGPQQHPWQRKDAHRPRTGPRAAPTQQQQQEQGQPDQPAEEEDCYVLTLLTDGRHHADMSALRRRWFPQKLLKVDAHVTLFHALPASRLETVRRDVEAAAARTARFAVQVRPRDVFRMGKGVGVEMDRESLARVRALREGLRARWNAEGEGDEEGEEQGGWLSEQDSRRGWKGHYTVMNKENDRTRMEQCAEELTGEWRGSKGVVNGLTLWRYDRGWWKKSEDFLFRG